MTVLTAIIELTKASWRVLRRHPQLIWFPILSLLATTTLLVVVLPIVDQSPWLVFPLALFGIHAIHAFFAVGLTSEALGAMRGKPRVSVSGGLAAAASRGPAIAVLAAITGTIGFLLEVMGRSKHPALRLARVLFGTAWSLATYLAIPVMVQERRGGIPSLKRSGDLFRRTWGETTLSEVGVRIITQHLFFILLVVAFILLQLLGESLFTVLLVLALFAGAVSLIGALEAIYRSALYVFASEGVVPEPFGGPELDAIWRVKSSEPEPSEPSEPPPLSSP